MACAAVPIQLPVYLKTKELGSISFMDTLITAAYIHTRYLSLVTMSKLKVSILAKNHS
jgi:hypothetical protein